MQSEDITAAGFSCPYDESIEEQKESLEVTVEKYKDRISYSNYFFDDDSEYRHVILPKNIAVFLPKNKLLSEEECIKFGVNQSAGWIHYMIHNPEPHVLMFKREKNYREKYLLKKK